MSSCAHATYHWNTGTCPLASNQYVAWGAMCRHDAGASYLVARQQRLASISVQLFDVASGAPLGHCDDDVSFVVRKNGVDTPAALRMEGQNFRSSQCPPVVFGEGDALSVLAVLRPPAAPLPAAPLPAAPGGAGGLGIGAKIVMTAHACS